MPYIYESPDQGKTVYRREFGQYDKRELVKSSKPVTNSNVVSEPPPVNQPEIPLAPIIPNYEYPDAQVVSANWSWWYSQ